MKAKNNKNTDVDILQAVLVLVKQHSSHVTHVTNGQPLLHSYWSNYLYYIYSINRPHVKLNQRNKDFLLHKQQIFSSKTSGFLCIFFFLHIMQYLPSLP